MRCVCARSRPAGRAKPSGRPTCDRLGQLRPRPGEASETHEAAPRQQRACPHLLGRRGSQVKGHNASEEAGDREGQPGNGQFNLGRAERGDGPGRAHVRHPGLLGRTPGAVPGTAQGDRSPWRRGRGRKPFSRHRSDTGRSLCDLQSPRVARGVWLTRKFLPGLQCTLLCRPDRQTAAGSGPGRVCPKEPEDAEPSGVAPGSGGGRLCAPRHKVWVASPHMFVPEFPPSWDGADHSTDGQRQHHWDDFASECRRSLIETGSRHR